MQKIIRKNQKISEEILELKNISYNSNKTLTLTFDDKQGQVLLNFNDRELKIITDFIKGVVP